MTPKIRFQYIYNILERVTEYTIETLASGKKIDLTYAQFSLTCYGNAEATEKLELALSGM